MAQFVKTNARKLQRKTFIWMFGVLAVVSALLYWEQAALLFVISTLAVCTLLLVVAFADLEGKDKELNRQVEVDRVPHIEIDVAKESSSPVLANPQGIERQKGAV
ncbi:MAG TPA: hypothetical protein VNO50_01370 [Pyrinomonadaceae bacterium]|nr:hypothetical protein [Pyrinomonadaceae bacterium]